MPINPCDLVGAELQTYADGAKDLESFAKQVRARYGEKVSPTLIKALFKKASLAFEENYKSLDAIKTEMASTVVAEARKGRSFGTKVLDVAANVSAARRTAMTTMDLSMTMKQGAFATLSHPIMGAKNFGSQVRSMFGSRKYGATGEGWARMVDQELTNDPMRPLADAAGIEFQPLDAAETDFLKREESYQSTIPGKIPGVRNIVRASERAAATYLNKMRMDTFKDMIRKADPGDGSLPLEQATEIADYVMNSTGRGRLPNALQGSAKLLSTVFFSPRLAASRVRYLTGLAKLGKLPFDAMRGEGISPAQRVIAKEYARTLGSAAVVLGLARAAGAEVNVDPRHPDFLKIKFGNTRYDVLGSIAQYMGLVTRLVLGETENDEGKVRQLGEGGFKPTTRGDIASRFLRGKLAPDSGIIANTLNKTKSQDFDSRKEPWYNKQIGTDFVGRPTTVASELENTSLPMHITGFAQSLAEGEGIPKSIVSAISDSLGANANTHKKTDKKVPNTDILDAMGITNEGSMRDKSRFGR